MDTVIISLSLGTCRGGGLAVQLGVRLVIDLHNRVVICNDIEIHYDESKFGGSCDPNAATRRAIVRAAAEIGKDMK